jgi:hypothetical protein
MYYLVTGQNNQTWREQLWTSLIAGRKEEEVEKFIMPWLLTETDDQPALVTVTTKGYTITEAGLAELDRRGINHLGQRAVPKVND